MNPSDNETFFAPNARPSLEEVLQQYEADCLSSPEGSPPEPESYLAGFEGADFARLREVLEKLRLKYLHPQTQTYPGSAIRKGTKSGDSDETGVNEPRHPQENPPPVDRTIDHPPSSEETVDQVQDSGGTVEHVEASDGTSELVSEQTGQQVDSATRTFEHAPGVGTGEFVAGSSPTKDFEPEQKKAPRAIPQSVAGYEIIKVLGRGAMGVVYKARQRGLKRLVALKMILSGEHASEQDLARFQAEANAVAQLQHPGIVQIYEIGEDNGRPFFSLEFVDGPSLHKKLQGTPMSPKETAVLMKQMAEAMDYAHKRKVIHRDLKPANVLLTSDGIPKIGDFGLAKSVDDDESGLTKTGTVMGTPSYMSPEQALGLINEIGPLADVYSLGAMLYDMLTGRPPFRGTSVMDTLQQLRTREPVPPMQLQPSVPRDLETICLKCLQKEKTKRYESAGALAEDLGRFLDGRPILARPISFIERSWRTCKRNPKESIGLSVFIISLIGFIALLLFQNNLLAIEKHNVTVAKNAAVEAGEKETIAKNQVVAKNGELEISLRNETAAKELAIAARNEALRQEGIQKDTAGDALLTVQTIGNRFLNLLMSKRLALDKNPEIQKLRAETLKDLRELLTAVANRTRQKLTAENFGDILAMQIAASFLLKLGQKEEPLRLLTFARETLVKSLPTSTVRDKALANLGVLEQRIGDVVLQTDGDARAALKQFELTRVIHVEIQQKEIRAGASTEVINRSVGHDDLHLGKALVLLGRSGEAIKYFEEALKYYSEWSKSPTNKTDEPRSWMMAAHMQLGIARSRTGDLGGAEKSFNDSLEIGRVILDRNFRNRGYLIDLADAQGEYGDALLRAGKNVEAHKLFEASLKNLDEAYQLIPDDIEHQALLASANERLGVVLLLVNQAAEARPFVEKAKELREELVRMERTNISRRMGMILSLAHAGNYKNAIATAKENFNSMENSTELTLQMARCFSLCSQESNPLVNLKETAEQTKVRKQESIKLALNALQRATRDGYKDAAVIEGEPDFAAIKDEPEFKDLIAAIKSRTK